MANAAALVASGVTVQYGTDLGNGGIKPGADVRELELLAGEAGLGAEGAIRAATAPLAVGRPAGVVGLDGDPRTQLKHWRRPHAVVVGRTVLTRGAAG